MTNQVIPEAAVEAAAEALCRAVWDTTWDMVHESQRHVFREDARGALEAAAPFMRQAFFLEMNLKAVAEELAAPPIRPCR